MMRKIVYLTIDDSPSKHMKAKVDYLHKQRIPAIFFCIGKLMQTNPEAVRYAIKKGFVIGNHSYSHPHFSKILLEEGFDEIKETDEIIDSVYLQSGVKRKAKVFRFPYGDKGGEFVSFTRLNRFFAFNTLIGKQRKRKFQSFLRDLGYRQPMFEHLHYPYYVKHGLDKDADVFWTYDFEEYRLSLDEVFRRMKEKNPRQGGRLTNRDSADILLLHDHDATKEQFFNIIDHLIELKIAFKMPAFFNSLQIRDRIQLIL